MTETIKIGEEIFPYTWASSGDKPLLPEKPNHTVLLSHQKVGLVIPNQARIYIEGAFSPSGGRKGVTYFVRQEPATRVIMEGKSIINGSIYHHEKDIAYFLGIQFPNFNIVIGEVHPNNLGTLLRVAQEKWKWELEEADKIFKYLAIGGFAL